MHVPHPVQRSRLFRSSHGARQVKQADDLEEVLVAKFMRFLMQRAEQFVVLRRKPVEVCPLPLRKVSLTDGRTELPRATSMLIMPVSLSRRAMTSAF